MVKELRIYFEGDKQLKPGLHSFLKEIVETARQERCRVRLIDANGTPVQDFYNGVEANPNSWNVLLLDSEEPLKGCYRSKEIDAKYEGSVFWMVELMESWFLADIPRLSAFYGTRLEAGNPKVEEIPKADVKAKMDKASGNTYHKTKHAPKLLELIDPALVRKAAPNCDRMFNLILKQLSKGS